MDIEKDKIKNILFITLSNIGDVVLTLPVLGLLKKEFPKASAIVVTGGDRAPELFKGERFVRGVLVYNKRSGLAEKLRLIIKLRRMKFDMAIDMRHSLFPILAGARYRTTLLKKPCGVSHRRAKHLKDLEAIGISTKDFQYPVLFNREDKLRVNSIINSAGILPEDKLVAVAPGAKSHMKRWGITGFTDLCERLSGAYNISVALIGDENDKSINNRIISTAAGKIHDLSGAFNLRELAYFLSMCKMLITNDSAPLHIASAVDIPVVAIFGPTDCRKYGPTSAESIVIRKETACSPCEKAACDNNLECMRQISADDVFNAAEQILLRVYEH